MEKRDGESTSHKGKRLHSYDLAFKLKVITYAKDHGNSKAAKYFNVDRKRVREWRQNEDRLKGAASVASGSGRRKRLSGGGRKLNFPHIEEELAKWIKAKRDRGVRVTGKALKQEAIRQHRENGNPSFKASCSWLRRFMKRHNITFRRATHVAQKPETLLNDKMQGFLKFVIAMRRRNNYDLSAIGNMDETPVWIDMPGEYTLEVKGTKTISMASTGHEKTRITVCLAAMADGTKLAPLVLLKGVRPPKEIPSGIIIKMTPKAWADEGVMQFWLKNVWRQNSTRRLLVWDAFTGHTTAKIKKELATKYNSDFAIIPGGCTSKLQPCDVSWNKPFKDLYRDMYDDWLFDGLVSMTKGGNRRPPDKIQILKWIKEAWARISPDIIRKSFLTTGIANNMDGTQDDMLFHSDDSDDDDPFDGFQAPTAGDEEGQRQLEQNMAIELEAINEWSDVESEPDDDMCDDSDPDSPGN
jgi:hypothetical protein